MTTKDVCWGEFYGSDAVLKKIASGLKKHKDFYLDVEQFSPMGAQHLHSIINTSPSKRDPKDEILLKRIYQDRVLEKLTEEDLRGWMVIKVMGPEKIRTPSAIPQVRKFSVYMVSADEWLCDPKTGNRIMTRPEAKKLIDETYDEELILMQVVDNIPARKSLQTQIREAKLELNDAMDGVQDLILNGTEESLKFMQALTETLKTLKPQKD